MRRIIISIILGIIFPIVCFIAIGITTDFLLPRRSIFTEISIYGESAPGILFAPFSMPIYFVIYATKARIAPGIFDAKWFRLFAVILFDWVPYGLIIYWLLGRLERFKKQKEFGTTAPPPPPTFMNGN
jgi:hypothetical protein